MKKKHPTSNTQHPTSKAQAQARVCNSPLMMDVFERIAQERHRQNAALCISPSSRANYKEARIDALIAMGNVERVIADTPWWDFPENRHWLQVDLVVLAAHCVAWLEALEAQIRSSRTGGRRSGKLPPLTQRQIDAVLHGKPKGGA